MEISVRIEGPNFSLPAKGDLARTADQLESAFLAEMLKIAMPQASEGAFGGGIGESQFASFLTEQHAATMAARLDLRLMPRIAGDA